MKWKWSIFFSSVVLVASACIVTGYLTSETPTPPPPPQTEEISIGEEASPTQPSPTPIPQQDELTPIPQQDKPTPVSSPTPTIRTKATLPPSKVSPTARPTVGKPLPPDQCVAQGNPTPPKTYNDLFRDEYYQADADLDNYAGLILSYLNQGGDPEVLEDALEAIPVPGTGDTVHAALQVLDLDTDPRLDLIAWLLVPEGGDTITTALYAITCPDHTYQKVLGFLRSPYERFTAYDGYHLIAVQDMNANGVTDLAWYFRSGTQYTFSVYEWDGVAMVSRFRPQTDPITFMEVQYAQIQSGKISVDDIDGDGTYEFIAERDYDYDDMWMHCPGSKDIYAWDGVYYSLTCP